MADGANPTGSNITIIRDNNIMITADAENIEVLVKKAANNKDVATVASTPPSVCSTSIVISMRLYVEIYKTALPRITTKTCTIKQIIKQ